MGAINKRGSDLNKALAVGFVRNFLGEETVRQMFDENKIQLIDSWLLELLKDNKTLPIFIYFIQVVNKVYGGIRQCQNRGLTAIDNFI